jgi:hypothetical protein
MRSKTKSQLVIDYARDHSDAPYVEIAEAVGCSVSTVSTTLRHIESDEDTARRKMAGRTRHVNSRFADLTGQSFGRLTVIERARSGKSGWTCRCSCGRETFATATDLTRGQVTSCGRCARDAGVHEGDRFGALVALRRTGETDNLGRPLERWLCRCDCGKEVTRTARDLRNGHTTSCGCGAHRNATWRESFGLIDGTSMSMMTISKPSSNKSGVKGVFWDARKHAWHAKIKLRGISYDLGTYKSIDEAAAARRDAEKELFDPILEEHGRDATMDD